MVKRTTTKLLVFLCQFKQESKNDHRLRNQYVSKENENICQHAPVSNIVGVLNV